MGDVVRWLHFSAVMLATAVIVTCAGTSESTPDHTIAGGGGSAGGEGGKGGSPAVGGSDGGAKLMAQSCPDGSYAVDLDADGMLICAPFDADVAAAVQQGCSLYFGWRDGCSGCSAGPSKAGRVDASSCDNIAGADNTCTEATLGAASLPLFGLNTDGDVDGNDMFYAGWYCLRDGETSSVGPCGSGEHAVRVTALGHVTCMSSVRMVAEYVRDHCSLYFGWRDGCSGCPDPPAKWGFQRGTVCELGVGSDSVCGIPFVDAQWVPMVGINTDGDVDDNDTFFVGLSCDEGSADTQPATERCPFGTLLVGINDDGTLQCASPSVDIAPIVRSACRVYFGYRDGCGGCTDPPAKWGSTSTLDCDPTGGSTCGAHLLDGATINLLGINTDGDVDGNDKLYVGLSCG